MRLAHVSAALALAVTCGIGSVAAQSIEDTVAARQGQFKLLSAHVGPLIGMAQGDIEYDAETAQIAADNLARLAGLDQTLLWPEGSDTASIDGTRALPAIWEDPDGFVARLTALQEGTAAMQDAAGQGLDEMRAALGGVGGACSACHEDYRAPN